MSDYLAPPIEGRVAAPVAGILFPDGREVPGEIRYSHSIPTIVEPDTGQELRAETPEPPDGPPQPEPPMPPDPSPPPPTPPSGA